MPVVFVLATSAMDLRRERKRSLKVREQQEAELERMDHVHYTDPPSKKCKFYRNGVAIP